MIFNEEKYEEYLKVRENLAWDKVKDRLTSSNVPKSIQVIIKDAFIIGYNLGTIEEEKVIKQISKQDPIQFYEWLKEE